MASIFIMSKIFRRVPNLFAPAKTNGEVFVAGVSKIYVEHYLLMNEAVVASTTICAMGSVYGSMPCVYLGAAVAISYVPIVYLAPIYRTYKKHKTVGLDIIQV